MSMKDKISRAFTQDQPNVLNRVLRDCPEKAGSTRKKRKRLSDRAVEFISTAASLAILISAVFGGVAYIRNNHTSNTLMDNTSTSSGNWGTTDQDITHTLPPETLWEPHPDDTAGYDASIEGLIMRTDDILYPLEMWDSEYQLPDVPVDLIEENGMELYRINRTMNGYCFDFLFHAKSGILLRIDVLPCDCVKTGPISSYAAAWIAAIDLAPGHYGASADCDYTISMEQDDTYRIDLDFVEPWTYYIDAFTGKILGSEFAAVPETIHAVQARDNALAMWDIALRDVRTFKLGENGNMYEVYFESGEYAYTFFVSALDGSIIYDEGRSQIGLHPTERMEHLIGWQKARDICLDACGRQLDDLICFTWDYVGNPDSYLLELSFQDDYFSFRIDAFSGGFIETQHQPTDTMDLEKAGYLAARAVGQEEAWAAGKAEDFAYKYDETAMVYWIYFRIMDTSYEICVDAVTGDILTSNAFSDTGILSQEDAIRRALNFSHRTEDEFTKIDCYYVAPGSGRGFYLVVFDHYLYTMVDATTSRIMDVGNAYPTDGISKQAAVKAALGAIGAEEWDRWALAMCGTFNDGQPFWCVLYNHEDSLYICTVDGYSGQLMSHQAQKWVLGNSADLAMYAALDHVGLTVEDVTCLTYEYDDETDPTHPRFWISFQHGTTHYRVAVSHHNNTLWEILNVIGLDTDTPEETE